MVSWSELTDVVKKLSRLSKESQQKQANTYATAVLDCTVKELEVLNYALLDNINWIRSGYRTPKLSDACANPKLLQIMKKLFVLEVPTNLTFLADGAVIADSVGESGGLNWDRTPKIIRKRKNKIMNWGTEDTVYDAETTNEMRYEEPVILTPEKDLSRQVVFFNSPKLVAVCKEYQRAAAKLKPATLLTFWNILYSFALAIIDNKEEHECFTYSTRVPCNVFLVKRSSLVRNKWHTSKAPRQPVTGR